jgi:hypothetical protein
MYGKIVGIYEYLFKINIGGSGMAGAGVLATSGNGEAGVFAVGGVPGNRGWQGIASYRALVAGGE